MNEVNVAGLNAVEEAMRDDKPVYAETKAVPKKFERRDTIAVRRGLFTQSRDDQSAEPTDAHSLSHMDAMLTERNSIHGDFTGNATTAQALKYVMRQGKNWEEMPAWMRESLEQMQTKVARILSGDFNHPDHWKDLQGYPRLVETRLEKK